MVIGLLKAIVGRSFPCLPHLVYYSNKQTKKMNLWQTFKPVWKLSSYGIPAAYNKRGHPTLVLLPCL